jgi:hypothetical protein
MDPSQIKPNFNNPASNTNDLFNVSKPINLVTLMILLSPIIMAFSITSMSVVFQNFKGFIYLAFLIGSVLVRELVIYNSNTPIFAPKNSVCNKIMYSPLGNSTFSLFVISFSIFYLCWPMFLNKSVNYWLLSGLLLYLLVDLGYRSTQKCYSGFKSIFVNILAGFSFATIIVVPMFYYGGKNSLFFNEVSSDKETCSLPTKQKFKCAVYKNGELISNIVS